MQAAIASEECYPRNTTPKPVAFCSRTLTAAKRGYAHMEKERVAAVWVSEKFERYLLGLENFKLETDQKLLVTLMNTKNLQDAPLWCQRMLMRLMWFHLLGLENFKLETDQKLLVTLVNTKNLQDAPLWCQRMLMRLMWFHPTACIFCMEEAT